ncbi:MAG: HEAT repeat domain-containing protein [Planctomycetes bacterium]|nr:HEAT repeat domain-containing protein [Planctomycetota bacterium]
MLVGLSLDNQAGRQASDGEVNERTRSFATYGLGLMAYKTASVETKTKAFQALKQIIADDNLGTRQTRVAAIHAMSLLNIGSATDAEKNLLGDALKVLEDYYMRTLGSGEQLIQSHCATAIAKLITRDHEKADHYKELFAADLAGKGKVKRAADDIGRACAMALGQLCRPNDDKDEKKNPDGKYSDLLLETFRSSKDKQTKYFSVLALGQIGGELNRTTILKEFERAGKTTEKPWCALSLGVFSFFSYEAQKRARNTSERDRFIGETLYEAFKGEKEPSLLAALAVGMGLNQHVDAADALRDKMLQSVAKEGLAGYLCIALALMNDMRSKEPIRDIVNSQARRVDLLKQAAIALGKLGDKSVAELLQAKMAEETTNLAKLSAIASALGFIGDSRTIAPLKAMLLNKDLGKLPRAFAAVALGGIADKETLPWNSKIAVNTNYRASVDTLTNRTSGILDIL